MARPCDQKNQDGGCHLGGVEEEQQEMGYSVENNRTDLTELTDLLNYRNRKLLSVVSVHYG